MIAAFLLLMSLAAQDLPPVSAATDYARLHEGINPPKLLHSKDPEYTPAARAAGIEGSVVVQAVIDRQGNVAYASVLSPLPAGLDDQALLALQHWKYTPGSMDNENIPVLMTVDVLFRLPYDGENAAREARQKAFDALVHRTMAQQGHPSTEDVAELEKLAASGMIPAIGLRGEWRLQGRGVAPNPVAGLADLKRAADANDARSLFLLGQHELEGKLMPGNEAQGWSLLARSAWFGDADGQRLMAERAARQNDWKNAEKYFRLCAATRHAYCEYRLGKLLVQSPNLTPGLFSQGVTWLELAKEHGDPEAAVLWETSTAKLSSLQWQWVAQLKPQLELKHYRGF